MPPLHRFFPVAVLLLLFCEPQKKSPQHITLSKSATLTSRGYIINYNSEGRLEVRTFLPPQSKIQLSPAERTLLRQTLKTLSVDDLDSLYGLSQAYDAPVTTLRVGEKAKTVVIHGHHSIPPPLRPALRKIDRLFNH